MDRKERLKIILILSLSLLIIALIYFYINNDSDSEIKAVTVPANIPVNPESLNSETDSLILTFGIKKEWIGKIVSKEKANRIREDGFLISKEVLIPVDLPVIELNSELTEFFKNRNLFCKVTEDPKSKNIQMELYSANDTSKLTKGIIKLRYSDTLSRNTSDICIVLDSIDAVAITEAESILKSSQEFSVFLPLRNDKADYQSLITDLKKDYLVKFITGDDDNIMADFKEGMKESQWKSKVRSASLSFINSSGIILYNKGSSKEFYLKVFDEFIKNNIKIYQDTLFTVFRQGGNKALSLIESIKSENAKGKKFLTYCIFFNEEEFTEFEKSVSPFKKYGYRFFNFGDLQIKKNKILAK